MNPLASDSQASAVFVRGLTLGALIGAIIAGSSIWSLRRRRRNRPRPTESQARQAG